MNADNRPDNVIYLTIPEWRQIPFQERLLDRLVDLLLDADEILESLRVNHAPEYDWAEVRVRGVLNDIDGILKQLTD